MAIQDPGLRRAVDPRLIILQWVKNRVFFFNYLRNLNRLSIRHSLVYHAFFLIPPHRLAPFRQQALTQIINARSVIIPGQDSKK